MTNAKGPEEERVRQLLAERLTPRAVDIVDSALDEIVVLAPHRAAASAERLESRPFPAIRNENQSDENLRRIRNLKAGGHGGAGTIKVSNVKLALGRLFLFGTGSALALVGAGSSPILLLLAIIGTAYAAADVTTAKLTENEASIVWAAYKSEVLIQEDVLADRTNEERKAYGLLPLSGQQFRSALENLVALGCIERSGIFSYHLVENVVI